MQKIALMAHIQPAFWGSQHLVHLSSMDMCAVTQLWTLQPAQHHWSLSCLWIVGSLFIVKPDRRANEVYLQRKNMMGLDKNKRFTRGMRGRWEMYLLEEEMFRPQNLSKQKSVDSRNKIHISLKIQLFLINSQCFASYFQTVIHYRLCALHLPQM